jgi:hypothetical protein
MLQEMLGTNKRVRSVADRTRPEMSEVFQLVSSPQRAAEFMQWRPTVTLSEGLRRVIEFVKQHPERYRPFAYAT